MDNKEIISKLIEYLTGFITPERLNTFNKVLENRTNYLTVVLEDLFQPHNASAVLRSCDCFGIQNVHIIENRNIYSINPDVALGSHKWLTLTKYNLNEFNTREAYQHLRTEGYRIVATVPQTDATALTDFNLLKGKSALVFGTELEGLSDIAVEEADEYLQIPMFGFTESFNISVSAAIILYQLSNQMRKTDISWQLTPDEKEELKLEWLKRTIKKSDLLIKKFMEKQE